MLVEILPHTYLNPVVRNDNGEYEVAASPSRGLRGGYSHMSRLALLLPFTARFMHERWPLILLEETLWSVQSCRLDYAPDFEAWLKVGNSP